MHVGHHAVEAGYSGESRDGAADLVSLATAEVTAVVTAEFSRCLDDWRGLVGRVVERTLEAARREAEATAERAHQQARIMVAEVQAVLADRESELKSERAELQMTREKLDALRTELALVREQLEGGQAERLRLLAELDAVQHELPLIQPDGSVPGSVDEVVAASGHAPLDSSDDAVAGTAECRPIVAGRNLKLVSHAEPPSVDEHPELVAYANGLLDQAEEAYWTDLESARAAMSVVDRLTENLRTARDLFARRSDSVGCPDSPLFKERIIARLNARGETSFGRHLAVSSYQLYPIRTQPAATAVLRAS